MAIAIKVENLSKAYQLGQIGTGTISRDLERWWARTRGKEDPFLKIGEVNDRTTKSESDIVWSLKDINFEITQGDAVGIIGRNGAGKSTLLKILSRVTSPTTGTIKAKGRIASLLEVGTGFHPELTGRENIYLNGAILGMRKREITRKLEEIIDFSGVERYIDTPVKRYSSGMYVRLAFAVAAHLDSEILIVDEVLAVGDAEFQKKCLGKMGEVSKGLGKTILFVSHNMTAMRNLCDRGILLSTGALALNNTITKCIDKYESSRINSESCIWINNERSISEIYLKRISILNYKSTQCNNFLNSEKVIVSMVIKTVIKASNFKIGFDLINNGSVVFRTQQIDSCKMDELEANVEAVYECEIPPYFLNTGTYYIKPLLTIHLVKPLSTVNEEVLSFSINIDSTNNPYHAVLNENNHPGVLFPQLKWNYIAAAVV
jgi:lipopolysaccharide transport system ATP-binding protein